MKKEATEDARANTALEIDRGNRSQGSLRDLRIFSSLKSSAYRLYYGGMMGQFAASNMQQVVRSLLIYRLTGSAALLGGVSLASAIPQLLLSLPGGVLADRMQKRHILFAVQVILAVISLVIALALALGYLSPQRPGSWWILFVASIFDGAIMGLIFPSRQAIVRETVDAEQVMNALALNSLGLGTFRLLAPALAGFLVDAFDFGAVFFTMTAMYLIGAIFFALMPSTSRISAHTHSAMLSIKEGFQYIRRETAILFILGFMLFVVVLSFPYQYLLPIFTEDILKVSATKMGVLLSGAGIGSIVGSLCLVSLPNRKRGTLFVVSGLILGIALVSFSFSNSWYLSLVAMFFVGVGQIGRMTLGSTLIMNYTEDEYRGRVFGIYEMEFGITSFGVFLAALLSEVIGVQWAVGGFALILVFISILALAFLRPVRKLN